METAVVIPFEVFVAAGGPLVNSSLEVVHDPADVGAGATQAVVARTSSSCTKEVVVHASVVANLMRHGLENSFYNTILIDNFNVNVSSKFVYFHLFPIHTCSVHLQCSSVFNPPLSNFRFLLVTIN